LGEKTQKWHNIEKYLPGKSHPWHVLCQIDQNHIRCAVASGNEGHPILPVITATSGADLALVLLLQYCILNYSASHPQLQWALLQFRVFLILLLLLLLLQ